MKIVAMVVAILLQGCFIDSLCGTKGDDDPPAAGQVHRAPEPNPPVVGVVQ